MSGAAHMLVLGGQRSGKSRFAERLVLESGLLPVYVATGEAGDGEMAERIRLHRDRRGVAWETVEEPLEVAATLDARARAGRAVLVDCLTLWLANLMAGERDIDRETGRLTDALDRADGPVVLVSNEVGAGVIPANPLGRRYVDALGILNQRAAAAVGRVVLMTAGLPLQVKPPIAPEPRL